MKLNGPFKRSLAPLAFGLCVWLLSPAQALGRALVRFIHGVPGVGRASVDVNTGAGNKDLGSIGFAQSTHWRSVRSGAFHWTLTGTGGKPLATGTATVGNGAYDIVVLETSMKVWLGIYKAEAGKPGASRVRFIHGAPELGSPMLMIDSRDAVKSIGYTKASAYVSTNPGTHTLGAMRPGATRPSPSMSVAVSHARLEAGGAYSAVVLGTRGQRVQVVTLTDRGAPLVRPAASRRATPPSTPVAQNANSMVVGPGDSLWTIARKLAGPGAGNVAIEHKVVSIWNLNIERIGTGDPNLIFSGTRLHLPA